MLCATLLLALALLSTACAIRPGQLPAGAEVGAGLLTRVAYLLDEAQTPAPTTSAAETALPLPTPLIATPSPAALPPSATPIMLATMPPATALPLATIAPEAATTAVAQPTLPPPRATLPPEVGQRGELWTVLFTPGGGEQSQVVGDLIVDNLVDFIDAAQSSIHLAVYEMNLAPVAQALIRAHDRGVDVRFVTDDEGGLAEDGEEGNGQFAVLQAAGVPVRADTRSALMHNKFIIIDNAIFITGSTNLTSNDIYKNNNNIVAGYLPEVAAIYEREFEEMWNGEFGPTSPSQAGQAVLNVEGKPFVVLFAPEDEPFDTLVQLVSAAESSIRFMAFSFTNDALGLAMLERFQAGVDVQGIFEVRGSETEYAELPRLYCAGVPVRQDGNPATFHHKVVIIDDYVVITGSMNFSDSAAESNDENMVAIAEPLVAQLYDAEFGRRWAEATDPLPEDMNCPPTSGN